jgi:caffeoyl-CoA O-methyltransferase
MLTLVKPEIETYATSKSFGESPLLQELRMETEQTMELPQMLCGPLQGAFLRMITEMIEAERVLEIGTFTGYSTLWMASGLAGSGTVITLEIEPKHAAVARKYFERASMLGTIDIRMGPALDTIADLEPEFDLCFIDADKVNYLNYYEAVLPLMRFGGIIVVDNVLYGGEVLDPQNDNSKAISRFNDVILADDRVHQVMLPMRDGISILRKR